MNWLINGEANSALSPLDRGVAYGDGVFRTLKVRCQRPVWWRDQYEKLTQDCAALQLVCPAPDLLLGEIADVTQQHAQAVVKVVVTRGLGERGYAPPHPSVPTRIVMASPLPENDVPDKGVHVRWCNLRLARQPQLAGIKHLNRLENVLARQEWSDPDIAEGLLCDDTGAVVGGTKSNLFVVRAGDLFTPDLTFNGVAGVTRERVLRAAKKHGVTVRVARLDADNIYDADEVFLCNSIMGLSNIASLEHVHWHQQTWTEQFRRWIDETD